MEQYPTDDATPQSTPSRSAGTLPLVLSGLAIAVSLVALIITLTSSPLGKGIDSYDFSTPEAALKSRMQIEADRDIQAKLDMERIRAGDELEEAVRTLEINKTVDFEDKKVIFFSYLKKGKKVKRTMGFEKNLESKMWFRKYVDSYEVSRTNEQLAKEMRAWVDEGMDENEAHDHENDEAHDHSGETTAPSK